MRRQVTDRTYLPSVTTSITIVGIGGALCLFYYVYALARSSFAIFNSFLYHLFLIFCFYILLHTHNAAPNMGGELHNINKRARNFFKCIFYLSRFFIATFIYLKARLREARSMNMYVSACAQDTHVRLLPSFRECFEHEK